MLSLKKLYYAQRNTHFRESIDIVVFYHTFAVVLNYNLLYIRSDELSDNEKMQAGIERIISIGTRPHK